MLLFANSVDDSSCKSFLIFELHENKINIMQKNKKLDFIVILLNINKQTVFLLSQIYSLIINKICLSVLFNILNIVYYIYINNYLF